MISFLLLSVKGVSLSSSRVAASSCEVVVKQCQSSMIGGADRIVVVTGTRNLRLMMKCC